MSTALAQVMSVYQGSDGGATKALYASLEQLGPVGAVAVNLLRAQKSSARAKVYRGGLRGHGSFRSMAYDRKQWAMNNLVQALLEHGAACGLQWGWGVDPRQEYHQHVLYVELPCGQVSFHTDRRGAGPDAPREWDGVREASPGRICRWASELLEGTTLF